MDDAGGVAGFRKENVATAETKRNGENGIRELDAVEHLKLSNSKDRS